MFGNVIRWQTIGSNLMKNIPNNLFFSWIESELSQGRSAQFRVKGNSMFPLLSNGKDSVVLCRCNAADLKPMDVVLFRYRGSYVLHRIISRDGEFLSIQGDGSYVAKETCTTDDVVGKVTAVVRKSGRRVSTNSWRWRIPSFIWRNTGIFRTTFLKILHRIMR